MTVIRHLVRLTGASALVATQLISRPTCVNTRESLGNVLPVDHYLPDQQELSPTSSCQRGWKAKPAQIPQWSHRGAT